MRASIYWEKSVQLRSKLVKSIENNFSFRHLKVAFQSPYTFSAQFRFEDTLDKKIRSNLA